jgi:hypothetical protein
MLNYFQDMVTRICSDANHMDDEGRKVFTSGIGLVQTVLKPNQSLEEDLQVSKKPDLELVVNHSDWHPIVESWLTI